jgi:hypothetical protein
VALFHVGKKVTSRARSSGHFSLPSKHKKQIQHNNIFTQDKDAKNIFQQSNISSPSDEF